MMNIFSLTVTSNTGKNQIASNYVSVVDSLLCKCN